MVHVAYCFDRNYGVHAGVSLTSLLLNHEGDGADLHVHLVTDAAAPELMAGVDRLSRTFRAAISVHRVHAADLDRVRALPSNSAHFSQGTPAVWFRLALPEILDPSVERVIYLDSDTVVTGDIASLFAADLGEAALGAVLDYNHAELGKPLGLDSYVNSGVLLMDLVRWRRERHFEACLAFAERNRALIRFGDQCALNGHFRDRVRLLEPRWNRYVVSGDRATDPGDAGVLHFITGDKPWHAWHASPLARLYWRYRDVSPWAGGEAQPPRTLRQWSMLAKLLASRGDAAGSARAYEQVVSGLRRSLAERVRRDGQ